MIIFRSLILFGYLTALVLSLGLAIAVAHHGTISFDGAGYAHFMVVAFASIVAWFAAVSIVKL